MLNLDKIAFCLDIDGVLKRGKQTLENGIKGLSILKENKIPYVLLTNGTDEEEHYASHLSKLFGVEISPSELVLSNTPVNDLLKNKDEPVLLCGDANFAFRIARSLGLTNAILTAQVAEKWGESIIVPQCGYKLPQDYLCSQKPIIETSSPNFPHVVRKVLVLNDSDNFYLDLQIAFDAVTRNGVICPYDHYVHCKESHDFNSANRTDEVKVYVTNPDLAYSDKHVAPRLTIGAFANNLVHLLKTGTDEIPGYKYREENFIYMGKPYKPIYDSAIRKLHEKNGDRPIKKIIAVGDSLTSDIAGGNSMDTIKLDGADWESWLVLCGKITDVAAVEQMAKKSERFRPKKIYSDLLEGIKDILSNKAE